MNIGIVGGRDFKDYDLLKRTVEEHIKSNTFPKAIVSGGATGADTLAEDFASEIGVKMIIYLPEREKYGRLAALLRNTQIIEASDVVFAFWDGKSRGTLDSIKKAKKMEKELYIISY